MTMSAPQTIHSAAPRSGPLGWFLRGGWYVFVVVLSLGILSFVPFVHAALRTRRAPMWLLAGLYIAGVIAMMSLTSTAAAGALIFGLMIIASVHSLVLRRQVWSITAPGHPATGAADPAVAAVLAARARREHARGIAERDPQMARELHIGRPDLSRSFDDGGLVDLNHAPAQAIAAACDIELAVARRVVDARAAGLAFTTVDDVFAAVEVPYPLWERVRDRAVVVAG